MVIDSTVEPVTKQPPLHYSRKKLTSSLFFGNNNFYVFFRLFEILYERLFKAKELSKLNQSNSQFAVLLNPNKDKKQLEQERDKFQLFLKHLNGFMLGAKEQNAFEDECRSLFGVQAYILFTIDKLVGQLTRHVQILYIFIY
jgi:paired amphipathic helix protein Sin3a